MRRQKPSSYSFAVARSQAESGTRYGSAYRGTLAATTEVVEEDVFHERARPEQSGDRRDRIPSGEVRGSHGVRRALSAHGARGASGSRGHRIGRVARADRVDFGPAGWVGVSQSGKVDRRRTGLFVGREQP